MIFTFDGTDAVFHFFFSFSMADKLAKDSMLVYNVSLVFFLQWSLSFISHRKLVRMFDITKDEK